ncbi:MAG: hypothetical protein ACI9LM_002962 [Alteromonadaceae bacterium]|jgi:hypothetical protein
MHLVSDSGLTDTWCGAAVYGEIGCTSSFNSLNHASDFISSGYDSLFDSGSMVRDGGHFYNRESSSRSWAYETNHDDIKHFSVVNDEYTHHIKISTITGIVESSEIEFWYRDTFIRKSTLGLTYVSVLPVPEPSTLAIFALGVMGFASRRFKKN